MKNVLIFIVFLVAVMGALYHFGYADLNFFNKDEFDRERQCEDVKYLYNNVVRFYLQYGFYPRNLEELTPEYIANLQEYLGHYEYTGSGSSFAITFKDLNNNQYSIGSEEELREFCGSN